MLLKGLIEKINEISRKTSVTEISDLTMNHILDFFKFDYCVISFINYFDDKIESRYIKSKKYYTDAQLDEWKALSNHKLSSSDILVKAISTKEIIRVKGCNVDGVNYVIGQQNCPLNKKIYEKFEHQNLNRIFLALVHRAESIGNQENDIIIGILETGYIDKQLSKKISESKLGQLKIYVDNIAQAINNALNREYDDKFKFLIEKHLTTPDPKKYLYNVLNEFYHISKSASLDLIDFQYENYNNVNRLIIADKNKNLKDCESIIDNFNTTNSNTQPTVYKGTNMSCLCSSKIKTILSLPLTYFGSLVGILNLYFYNNIKFISIKSIYLHRFAKLIFDNYQKKLVSKSVSQIGLSFPISINIKEKYKNIITTLRDYFISDNVIIWQILDETSHTSSRTRHIASETLDRNYIKAGIAEIDPKTIERKHKYNKYDVTEIETELSPKIFRFCKNNGFNTYITATISYKQRIFGYIDVFLKRSIPKLATEDEIFLTQLVNKLGVSIQLGRLVGNFSEISNSLFKEDLSNVLDEITTRAKILLNAEPIILFVCGKNNEVNFSSAYYSGHFVEEKIRDLIFKDHEREVDLARIILEKGTIWIQNEDEYVQFKNSVTRKWDSSLFGKEFWYREKIKSFAAIRLKYQNEILGVMFVNYREETNFTHDVKEFINAFASLISVAIINAKLVAKIKEQREQLLKLAEITNPGSLAIGYIHDAKHTMFFINALISTLLYLLPDSKKDSKEGQSVIKSLNQNTGHLASLFTSLVSIAHEKKPIFKEENIIEIIEELQASFETRLNKNSIKLKINIQNKDIKITCDRSKILQVLINLFTNSIYALENKKYVNKEIKIEIFEELEKNRIKIVFKDNGIGIHEEDLKKVFRVSFTKRSGGSGFGLLVIKRIIDTHHGEIKVFSDFGNSTTFIIYLPIQKM